MGELLGRFHPLVVHLPIGILILAFAMELASKKEQLKHLKSAMPFVLQICIISSLLAVLTGWVMPKEGEFNERLIGFHFWTAISMTIAIILVYISHIAKNNFLNKCYLPLFTTTIILLSLTGHFGGSLTHGEGHLIEPLSTDVKQSVTSVDSLYVYADIIQPILKQKCYSCHNQGKQKGGLNMSNIKDLLIGGDDGPILIEGNSEQSSMMKRIHLPLEEKKHMPPKGKKQLADNEYILLEWWINNGPSFDNKVDEIEQPEIVKKILKGYERSEDDIDIRKIQPVAKSKIKVLRKNGVEITHQSENSPMVSVSLSRDTTMTSRKLKMLKQIADNINELDLSFSNVDDNLLSIVKQFKHLQKLEIQNTEITSSALKHLEGMQFLRTLNLYGTEVDDQCFNSLEKIKSLKSVYLWQSKVTDSEVETFASAYPAIHIQSGIDNSIFGDAQLKPPIIKVDTPIFDDTTRIEMSLSFKNVKIYYTLDGSDPDTISLIYESPFLIDRTTSVKAISYKDGWKTSEVVEKVITKAGHKIAHASLDKPPSPKYKGKGGQSLIDFNQGSTSFSDGSWLGYEGQHMTATLNLGSSKRISDVVVGALEDTGSYIFFPNKITVSSSIDGRIFKEIMSLQIPIAKEPNPADYKSFLLQFEPHESQFLKVVIFGTLKNPEWHAAPGEKNWIFIDEILVN
ncbi:MAG: hypothetical protein HKN68_07410 [Saprospiraceae bacterium]|nr:hypothetical protein [Saprospiraceae bacterium]